MRPLVRSAERYAVLRDLAARVHTLGPRDPSGRVAVAVDGFDGAGKTMLADELAEVLRALDGSRQVLRLSIDGFHRPRAHRVARGRGPVTFYEDSYDYDAFRRAVLGPFRLGEPVTPAVNDVERDRPVRPARVPVGTDTVLLVDGIFLQRPELAGVWDAAVWVDVPVELSVRRGNARVAGDHDDDSEGESNRRYVGGQRLYLAAADPRSRATWVLDNTDLERPALRPGDGVRAPGRAGRRATR